MVFSKPQFSSKSLRCIKAGLKLMNQCCKGDVHKGRKSYFTLFLFNSVNIGVKFHFVTNNLKLSYAISLYCMKFAVLYFGCLTNVLVLLSNWDIEIYKNLISHISRNLNMKF